MELWLSPWALRGLGCALLLGVSCSLVGVHLYLRRRSMMGDALSHAALPGVLVAWLLTGELAGWPMFIGALVAGLATVVLTAGASRLRRVHPDAAVALVFPVLFALGIIGISTVGKGAHLDLDCVLFGNLLGVTDASLWMSAVIVLVMGVGLGLGGRWLGWSAWDATHARLSGAPAGGADLAVLAAAAMVSVVALEAAGVVLTVAWLAIPAAVAHLLARSVRQMEVLAVGVAIGATSVGYVASLLSNTATSGVIVLMLGLTCVLVLMLTRIRTR
jgi:ABC-type Mn2+/Zn2+ transport system permease subunit